MVHWNGKPAIMFLLRDVTQEEQLQEQLRQSQKLVLDLSPTELIIKIDITKIQQVLLNLVVNARDAMPQGGKITLRTKRINITKIQKNVTDAKPGIYAYISVSDTGTGIKKEVLPSIFDPFYTTKKPGEGTGIGLAVVHGIVEQHGGWIEVYSEVGVGTTFHLYFPLIPEENEKKTIETLEHLLIIPVTILVNEPNDDIRQAMVIALQQQGHTVFEAKNGQEAIDLASTQEKPVDLLITEHILLGISARELIDKIKKINPDIKILYISGFPGLEDSFKDSGVELLMKPFTQKELSKKIQEMFQQA